MRPNSQSTEMVWLQKSFLGCLGMGLLGLLVLNGCKTTIGSAGSFPVPEPCDCVDANGEDHLCFDFVVDAPIVEPAMIRELQDFRISWSWRYAWQACHDEPAGNSGPVPFTEVWRLTDDTGATLASCDDLSPGCRSFTAVTMGNGDSGMMYFAGLEVPDGQPSATFYFTVELVDVPIDAECTDADAATTDGSESGCSVLQPNIQTVQFVVLACPCEQGTQELDVGIGSLTYDSSTGNNTITWQDCYDVKLCGQEVDQLVGSTGVIAERVRLYWFGLLIGTWDPPGTSVDIATCGDRTLDLGSQLPPGTYDVTVEIVSHSAIECHEDATNNSAALTFVIP